MGPGAAKSYLQGMWPSWKDVTHSISALVHSAASFALEIITADCELSFDSLAPEAARPDHVIRESGRGREFVVSWREQGPSRRQPLLVPVPARSLPYRSRTRRSET
jgi:hypothetical protein